MTNRLTIISYNNVKCICNGCSRRGPNLVRRPADEGGDNRRHCNGVAGVYTYSKRGKNIKINIVIEE